MAKAKACLLIPVYNHARALGKMLPGLKVHGLPCLLVDDGSDAANAKALDALAKKEKRWVRLLRQSPNQGKGAAVMTGVRAAAAAGYSQVLQIDADGQHDPRDVPRFLKAGAPSPGAIVCGAPLYDQSAPKSRLYGRWLTTVWIWINTLSTEIQDGMCGYRLYPVAPLLALFDSEFLGSRMDFDVELLVRLKWRGLRIIALPVQVRYPKDGSSNFRMFWDNVAISRMHTRLFFGMLWRLPSLLWAKWRSGTGFES
jgi:glycosyltransferase involved in cell wall biosynthesis